MVGLILGLKADAELKARAKWQYGCLGVAGGAAAAAAVAVLACVVFLVVVLGLGRRRTSPEVFARDARLALSASDSFGLCRAAFALKFSTAGGQTLRPPYGKNDLKFYVDGAQQRWPTQWSSYFITKPIQPDSRRTLYWWKTQAEIREWLGPGEHNLYFRFGAVQSNVLSVSVSDEGIARFRPRYVYYGWSDLRPSLQKRTGESALHKAVWAGREDEVRRLVTMGSSVDVLNDQEETPLHYGCVRGLVETVSALLAAGADVNRAAFDGWTALHQAALDGDVEIAELLLAAGALVDAVDDEGRRPLDVAARWGRKEVFALLIRHGSAHDVFTASSAGALDTVRGLLEEAPALVKAQYAARTDGRATALHFAAIWGRLEVAKLLLARGADPDSPSGKRAVRALHIAAVRGDVALAETLLSSGAMVNLSDSSGFTPLHKAARAGRAHSSEILLTHGADVNARDKGGRTPLYWAMLKEHGQVAELLRQQGGKE